MQDETLDRRVARHGDRPPKTAASSSSYSSPTFSARHYVRRPSRTETETKTETRYSRHGEGRDNQVQCPGCSLVFPPETHMVESQSRHAAVRSPTRMQRSPVLVEDPPWSTRHSSSSPRHSPPSLPRRTATPTILVAGGTGVGKSFFISLLCDRPGRGARVGKSLKSCTANVQSFPCVGRDGSEFNLIDTPGFDDSRLSDAEILTKMAAFLSALYAAGQHVHGVIFLHRITDVRLSGSSIKTAQIIKRICGERFRGRYALVTGMWDLVRDGKDKEVAYRREREMVRHPQFWDEIRSDDCNSFRFSGSRESALKVVDWFFDPRNAFLRNPPPLQISMQLSEGKLVSETDAGVFVLGELSKQRRQHVEAVQKLRREISEARQDRDPAAVEIYSEIQAREEFSIHQNDLMQRKMRLQARPRIHVYG